MIYKNKVARTFMKIGIVCTLSTSMFASTQMKSPWYLFSHGLADTHAQAYCYLQPGFVNNPLATFDYPDATTQHAFGVLTFGVQVLVKTMKLKH